METVADVALTDINGKFDQMIQSLDTLKDKQEDMASDISQIKEAVYDPDEGLYARLRALESWQRMSSRLIWLLVTAIVGIIAASAYKSMGLF